MLAVSFTTVRGTALTEYRWARCGNSVTSTKSAVTRSLSTANCWASRTAAGQWGQVGVENTCRCAG